MAAHTSFSVLLKRYRLAAGLSQEALAGRAGLSARTVSDLERGIYHRPRYDTLQLLVDALALPEPQQALLRAAARPELTVAPEDTAPATLLASLPLAPTPLIGRMDERQRIVALLRGPDARMVTITGTGGVGKTRLALQIAHDLAADFPDGVSFIGLAPLQAVSLVPEIIAQRLHLPEQAGTSRLEQVAAFLAPRRFLLVLDNFEHLLEAGAHVADLLVSCPRLRILLTSRAPLRLRAEQVIPLAPLAADEAVLLFRERAQAIRPTGTYSDKPVAAICERLDRLPLAIELAAMQVHLLSLPDLLERLTIRLPFLRGGARDLPDRQQTMRDAIAWSYELLHPTERQCFRALGVFVGGWTLEAAQAVCWAEDEKAPAEDTFLTLAALVDASLAQVEMPAQGSARFSMLEVLREYAVERLRAAGEEETCRRRHASYFARLADGVAPFGPGSGAEASRLAQDFPNGRAALEWARERGEVTLGLWLAGAFGRFWLSQGHLREAEASLEQMLALDRQTGAPETSSEMRATALYTLGEVLLSLDKLERAEALAIDALEHAQQRNENAVCLAAFSILGVVARRRGRLAEAVAYFIESETSARRAEAAFPIITSESASQQAMRESVRGTALLNRVELAEMQGDLVLATRLTEEGRDHAKVVGVPFVVAGMTIRLGHLARQQGNYAQAKEHYRAALELLRAFGSPTFLAWCLEGLAATLSAEDQHIQTTRLCGAATALREQAQTPLPPGERAAFERIVAHNKAALHDQAFAAEWALGAALTQEEALTYALANACG